MSLSRVWIESLADDVVALRLAGEHGAGTVVSVREALEDAIGRARAVAVDCSLAEFTDGTILQTVVEAQNDPRNEQKTIVLEFRTNDLLQEALEASGLLDFFPVADSELGAVDLATSARQRSDPWKIIGGPESPTPRTASVAPGGYRWQLCRYDDDGSVSEEREMTVFIGDAADGSANNRILEEAGATRGRSVVAALLETDDPPRVVTVREDGTLLVDP